MPQRGSSDCLARRDTPIAVSEGGTVHGRQFVVFRRPSDNKHIPPSNMLILCRDVLETRSYVESVLIFTVCRPYVAIYQGNADIMSVEFKNYFDARAQNNPDD